MAENKKSFIAYSDWDGMFQALPDEVAGKLIKHIFSYVNDRSPQSEDFIINALFEQVKSTLKRDLVKWEAQKEQRILAGKRSAEIRSTKINDRSNSLYEKERNPTVSVNVSVNDSDIINNNTSLRSEQFEKFWEFYGKHGAKKTAKQRFMKLTETEMDALRKHLPKYLKSTPDVKFRKHAERYLSLKLWENGDIEKLSQPIEYFTNPFDYWNRDLTPEEWKRVPPDKVQKKKENDMRRAMGV